MRWYIYCLISAIMIIGSSCRDNPVEELPTVVPAEIVLSANYSSILVGGEASGIYAYILADNGDTLGGGYEIRFEITEAPATSGPGSPSFEYIASTDSVLLEVTAVTNSNGRASTTLYSGTEAGNVTIKATYADNDEIFAEEPIITLLPVPLNRIALSAEYASIPHDGASTLIYAVVEDQNGDPTGDGYEVKFEITDAPSLIGDESPSFEYQATEDSSMHLFEAVTDINGQASVNLYSGTLLGIVQIKTVLLADTTIFSETPLVAISSDNPYNIELSAADSAIEVGGNTTTVYATLLDWHGTPAGDGFEIKLEIVGSFHSNVIFILPGDDDSILVDTTDINGQVSGELRSGNRAGPVVVRATALFDNLIYAEEPIIRILAGPPYHIDIFPSNAPEVDGEAIITGIAAAVWDQYTNPVEPLTPVHFEIIPDTIAWIEWLAYTGGWIDPETGDTIGVRGLTQTWLVYSCYHTFDTIRIIASCDAIVDTSAAFILGIYDAQLSLSAQPESLIIQSPDTIAFADLEAHLLDGLGCPIHNGVINFTTEVCGEISGSFTDTTDDQGYAYTEFMIRADDIPVSYPDPPQCTAIVIGRLRGYPEVEAECEIVCILER